MKPNHKKILRESLTGGIAAVAIYAVVSLTPAPQYPPGVLPPASYGTMNAEVTMANLKVTVCKPGWAASVRPSSGYTGKIKKDLIKKYGEDIFGTTSPSYFELDHVLSIEDGGSPTDPKNLYLEPWHLNVRGYDLGAKTKDGVENAVNRELCGGRIDLKEAQALLRNWPDAYKKYIGPWPRMRII